MMMDNDEKTIDLCDVALFLLSYKKVILGCVIACMVVAGIYLYFIVKPVYRTSLWVKLPQYCDNKDINTAVLIGDGEVKKIVYAKEDIAETDVVVKTARNVDTSVITTTFEGTDPAVIIKFADSYEKVFQESLNNMVNERLLRDAQITNLQSDNHLTLKDLQDNIVMTKVAVIKKGELPEKPLPQGNARKILLAGVLGLCLGMIVSVGQYLKSKKIL
jgi:uncharacterized protein involved in exopolysaccharide biosynthesis